MPSRTNWTATITEDDQENDPAKDDNEDDEDEDKDHNAVTTNQVPRMLRDMSIAVLRELRGFSLDNDNINLDGGNNTQQNNPDGNNN
ncbi:hypothetical protein Pint_14585 [Pistacia integerrima]|uniref:Uncharacterized protein n=1 Tax=Pistacia integerrima TaxID=434235 RepID=A0ACC0YBT7_9ROSI|nr:hypothetical protein Pint_14585 [Pistacia integerrima]